MTKIDRITTTRSTVVGRGLLAVMALLLCLAVLPSLADAKPYEVTGIFGGVRKAGEAPSEETQLNGVGSLAVNYSGAGNVAKGTLYAVVGTSSSPIVARFEPKDDSMRFREAWEVLPQSAEQTREGRGEQPYGICGPAVAASGGVLVGQPNCPPNASASNNTTVGVAVDQTTGNVYVSAVGGLRQGENTIREYRADGGALITSFGELGSVGSGQHTSETPAKIHESPYPGPIAVNASGELFMFDLNTFDNFYHRLMVFRPVAAGDYTAYQYAGQANDIAPGVQGQTKFPTHPVLDAAGNIYVAPQEGSTVEEYDPAQPAAPICISTDFRRGGITALTINPTTGEPFFYSYLKKPRAIHELSACQGGSFQETGEVEVTPERDFVTALAFDPDREISGQEPGTLYAAAPRAAPASEGTGQPGTSGIGYVFAPANENPPVVLRESVDQVTSSSARLGAVIEPGGAPARYAFRYTTEADYLSHGGSLAGAAEAPIGEGQLSAGGLRMVAETISGLASDTVYRFQLVARSNCSRVDPSEVCVGEGEVASLQTAAGPSGGLPDSRAYELVSPVEKQGGQVIPADPNIGSCIEVQCKPGVTFEGFPRQSTAAGDGVVYEGEPFGQEGAVIENEYLSRRTPSGWTTRSLAPTLLQSGEGRGYKAFSPSLEVGVLAQGLPPLSPSTPGQYRNLYSQNSANPVALTALISQSNSAPQCPQGSGNERLRVTYAGSSADLSRIFFEANDALTPDSRGDCGEVNLYEWAAGELRAVNILPGGTESTPGAMFGSGTLLKSGREVVTNAVSADGSRVFWSDEAGQVFVRVQGSETKEITDPGGGKFVSASPDGSVVLLSDGCLYSLATESCTDLTGGGNPAKFLGALGNSEDLSHVYFADTEVLATNPGAALDDQGAPQFAEPGDNNLYSWIDGNLVFVARLLTSDGNPQKGDWTASPSVRTAEASPDGDLLAFLSTAPLTGFANQGLCGTDNHGGVAEGPCSEAFLYDSSTGRLRCPSCNPSRSRPTGAATLRTILHAPGSLPQPRYLLNSGRLLFDSGDELVASDTNGRVEDVYEFEPAGVGDCARVDGCLSLISAGKGTTDSNFLAMDESGSNVFFTTRDRLLGIDKDEQIDLYDARVGGGFPETHLLGGCQGEACQPPAGVPSEPSPTSQTVPGASSPKSPACKKGKVKRNGHCVKKSKKKHHAKHKHKHKRQSKGRPVLRGTHNKGGHR